MKNEYGLDVNYAKNRLIRVLNAIDRYTPDELARELARISIWADEKVIKGEVEFSRLAFRVGDNDE